jgi:hypothetical protein
MRVEEGGGQRREKDLMKRKGDRVRTEEQEKRKEKRQGKGSGG